MLKIFTFFLAGYHSNLTAEGLENTIYQKIPQSKQLLRTGSD